MLPQYACIPALRVPQLRRGNGHLCWQTITRYERCWGPLLDQQVLSYCLGLSLRDLQEAMRLTLEGVLSLEACNRLVLALAERGEAWKPRRLATPPPIVMVDGCWIKIAYPSGEGRMDALGRRRAVKRQEKRVVLTALGVWPRRKPLDRGSVTDRTWSFRHFGFGTLTPIRPAPPRPVAPSIATR